VRARLVASLLAVVALGIASRRLPIGVAAWDKSLGDVLYAVMVYVLAALVRPSARASRLFALTVAICVAIETFQLTGIPARAPAILRLALGTTFAWHDVLCYVLGAAAAAIVHAVAARSTNEAT
jgi:hypothetical protein